VNFRNCLTSLLHPLSVSCSLYCCADCRLFSLLHPAAFLINRTRLLQSAHRFIAFSYRQASAHPQCSCSCHNPHQQVWQRVIKDTASWPSLAGCYWADSVSSGRYSIQVSAWHGSSNTMRVFSAPYTRNRTGRHYNRLQAPAYLTELCLPIAASTSRRGMLRSATTSNLVIRHCRLSTYGTRAFSVAGPVCWNALPDYLKSPDL